MLPCSDNFFRYFKNYDKYSEDLKISEKDEETHKSSHSNGSEGESELRILQKPKSPPRFIESPKYGLGLSPIKKFIAHHSPPNTSPVNGGMSTDVHKNFSLAAAAISVKRKTNPLPLNVEKGSLLSVEKSSKGSPVTKDISPSTLLSKLPLQEFQQSHHQTVGGKLKKQPGLKKPEVSPVRFTEGLRLPILNNKDSIQEKNIPSSGESTSS